MKFSHAIEGGITGATTLGLLEKALQDNTSKAPDLKLLTRPGIIKKLKKKAKKKGSTKVFVQLAKELLSAGAYYGVAKLGNRKNIMMRGGVLGALTGICMAYLAVDKKEKNDDVEKSEEEKVREQLITIALYTMGGLLAAAAIKKIKAKKKKK